MISYTILTFDVEEFDLPLEYNQPLDMAEQMQVGKAGLDAIESILENINCTLFTTANFANTFPSSIKNLSLNHEIASHTFYHSSFKNEDLLQSKIALEKIIEKKVFGLRMPRMRKIEMAEVINAGYKYDSSINPTYLPRRYNNLNLPRTIYQQEGMIRVPASVSPIMRLPLFWLAFKNYPYWFFKKLCIDTLKKDGYLSLYFHPWEFTDITKYTLPNYTKKPNGKVLLNNLQLLIKDLQQHSTFITMQDYLILKNKI